MQTSSNPISRIAWIIIACLAAVSLGLGFYVFTLRTDLAALRGELPSAHLSAQPENAGRLTAERDRPGEVEAPASADAKTTAVAGTAAAHPFAPFAQTFAAPEMRQMFRGTALRRARKEFADLLKQWNLPPAEADQFLQFVVDRDSVDFSDVLAANLAAGKLDANSLAEHHAAQQKTRQEHEARLKALLGDERYAEFAAAEARTAELKAVSMYRDHLEAAGAPLTDDQSTALAQIVTRERPDENELHPEAVEFLAQGMTDAQLLKLRQKSEAAHTRITQQAASFLSPDQMAALQAAFRSELDEQDLALKMTRSVFQNAGSLKR